MLSTYDYHFEWDSVKAGRNQHKDGISFDLAATAFLDPLMLTIPDEEHTESRIIGVRPLY